MPNLIGLYAHFHSVILPYSQADTQKHSEEKQKHQHKAQEKNPIEI